MKIIARLLYRLTANRPCRLIDIDGRPYLERYYLGQLLGITFYLHRFVRDDDERHLHNHPWNHALSLVLCGRYTEIKAEPSTSAHIRLNAANLILLTTSVVRWCNYIGRDDFHQISGVKPETWTLFMHTPRTQRWGFLRRTSQHIPLYEFQAHHAPVPPRWWKTAPHGRNAHRWPFGE